MFLSNIVGWCAQNVISRCLSAWRHFKDTDMDSSTTHQRSCSLLTLIPPLSLISPLFFLFIIELKLLIRIYLFFFDFFVIIKFQCRSYLVHRFLFLQVRSVFFGGGGWMSFSFLSLEMIIWHVNGLKFDWLQFLREKGGSHAHYQQKIFAEVLCHIAQQCLK